MIVLLRKNRELRERRTKMKEKETGQKRIVKHSLSEFFSEKMRNE
jgi:hypothetical protein